ncbi:hypothetical protein INQ10_23810, partial [Escherichia coli]
DPETEAKVLASLSSLNITRIMIAHRAQSVAAAGRVLVVADGQIQPMRFNNVSNMAGAGQ